MHKVRSTCLILVLQIAAGKQLFGKVVFQESAANSMNRSMQEEFAEHTPFAATSYRDESSRSRLPISAPLAKPISAVYARSPARDVTNSSVFHPSTNTEDTILCDEVEHLERDLTDFSLSSLNDLADDTRPLIIDNGRPSNHPKATGSFSASSSSTPSPSSVRLMTAEEVQRWHEKETREHKKADMKLDGSRRKEMLPEGPIIEEKSFSSRQSKQPPPDWTAEAQEAYKLLVECGRDLTNTPSPRSSPTSEQLKRITVIERKPAAVSPIPPRPATPPNARDNGRIDEGVEDVSSYSPQKRVHIIETKLLTTKSTDEERAPPGLPPKFDQKPPPCRPPKTRNIPVIMNGRSINYDNLNGIGAGRAPPPVPPKPKMNIVRPASVSPPPPATQLPLDKESPGFAPSITRGSLFNAAKTEEVIKF
ncbi:hypothetical protein OESDEN_08230 [Oesophagostomum dentatum]|uniref:WH2 domain-containing protein n=1 Tax=Oesophagostomum dentatum TaxID=61180 RepID=A0A0B1T928_OESDE|nr:hypothetical protein OESDEN_08230 [Oesophagostomum dentatum]